MKYPALLLIAVFVVTTCRAQVSKEPLHLITDAAKTKYGYVDASGDTVIPVGKYTFCFTETFNKLAIVSKKDVGLVGINREEQVLFNVYNFDNGSDEPSCGLFRIVKDGKIGYANLDGAIVIKPQFDCAWPFKNNKAKVGVDCKEHKNGEHHFWTGGVWHTINTEDHIVH